MHDVSLFWVGIDWGDSKHRMHIFRPSTGESAGYDVNHTAKDLVGLVERIKALGVEHLGGIAVESTRSPLIDALLDTQLPVYLVNPKVSKNWRDAYTPAGSKSDVGDACILAEGLWHHHKHMVPVEIDDALRRELKLLTEKEQTLIGQRTALIQQIKAALKQYYPHALVFFDSWASRCAWEFIIAFPTPQSLAKASKAKLIRFLCARHIGISPVWQKRIENRKEALEWPQDPAVESTQALHVQTLAKMLLVLENNLKEFRRRIKKIYASLEDAFIYDSLPGAGDKLAPRLCAIFGGNRDAYTSKAPIRQLSGAAPITYKSGQKKTVKIRRACNKKWRNTMHHFAFHSKRKSVWARAYYNLCLDRGDNKNSALRKLANKWLSIIFHLWKNKEPYDEKKYIEQLKKKNSSTYQYMVRHGYV